MWRKTKLKKLKCRSSSTSIFFKVSALRPGVQNFALGFSWKLTGRNSRNDCQSLAGIPILAVTQLIC